MHKIEKNDEYYDRCMYERINRVTLGETLLSPPCVFSDAAKQAWERDVKQYADHMKNNLGFWIHGFNGPYDIRIDIVREEGKILSIGFHLTSLADEGARVIECEVASIRKEVSEDRELVVGLADVFQKESRVDLNIIAQIDAQKKWHHARAAMMLMEMFEGQGASCRSLNFFKDMFALLRVVLPVDERMTKKLALVYDPSPHA